MIKSFDSKETEKIWRGEVSLRYPFEIQRIVRRKLRMLNNAMDTIDLRIPPSNRLEKLKGSGPVFFSIRINKKWRIIFQFINGHSHNVKIIDYH